MESMTDDIADLYRTADESGSPESAGTVAWNWISELARRQRNSEPCMLEIISSRVQGGGKVTRLYRGAKLLAVATTFRDEMNFTALVRWTASELRTPLEDQACERKGSTQSIHDALPSAYD